MRELLQRIESEELTDWIAYSQLEPFGEERADIRSAIIASTVAAAAGAKGVKLTDFIPKWQKPEPQPWQLVAAYFQDLAKRTNG